MNSTGSIEIIVGCMYSGKTTAVINLCKQWGTIMKILCINYADDTRYGDDNNLYSHDLNKIACVKTLKLSDIDIDTIKSSDIILINEGQFFSDLYDCCIIWSESYNKKLIISGLDGDFKREPFGQILKLIPVCDSITKLTALCPICKDGTKALFTHRLSTEKDQIVIGSSNYVALCRKHYCEKNKEK